MGPLGLRKMSEEEDPPFLGLPAEPVVAVRLGGLLIGLRHRDAAVVHHHIEMCEQRRLHVPDRLLGADLLGREEVDLLDLAGQAGHDPHRHYTRKGPEQLLGSLDSPALSRGRHQRVGEGNEERHGARLGPPDAAGRVRVVSSVCFLSRLRSAPDRTLRKQTVVLEFAEVRSARWVARSAPAYRGENWIVVWEGLLRCP